MKKWIPNSITLLNLVLGCMATIALLQHHFTLAFWLVAGGVLADFLDGMVARLLGVHSTLGKELDSIADTVTFGVVPGITFYQLLVDAWGGTTTEFFAPALPGLLVAAFAGLRLARFNLDTRQTDGFIGLPTPSATMFTLGLLLIYEYNSFGLGTFVIQPIFLYICIILLCWLMNAEIPMFSLKMKKLSWKGNELPLGFSLLAILLLVFLREAAFALIVLLYVLTSLFRHWMRSTNPQS
jgi:CDP-diacylglycerol--serine O-phosphatidyltransferase